MAQEGITNGLSASPISIEEAENEQFDLAQYLTDLAVEAGLEADSPFLKDAVATLEKNSITSKQLLMTLSQNLALNYLHLPLVVWLVLKKAKSSLKPANSNKRKNSPNNSLDVSRESKKSKKTVTIEDVQRKVEGFCQRNDHDPSIFIVEKVDSIKCRVCPSTFRLHGPGQLTRLRRHVFGDAKSTNNQITRHMQKWMCWKDQTKLHETLLATISPSSTEGFVAVNGNSTNTTTTSLDGQRTKEVDCAVAYLADQRTKLYEEMGVIHCYCLKPTKRINLIEKGECICCAGREGDPHCDFVQPIEDLDQRMERDSSQSEEDEDEDTDSLKSTEDDTLNVIQACIDTKPNIKLETNPFQ
eukprot:TRINITY_DN66_c0_g1_i1.p1 TRINITY_DN66_c0_g1~~TRINITY_DN66_c0_g1_i1.p1  ORF type:complete len:357 (+),score=71.57 TRINITY_DN66_c0_g1_i1:100-1170(+)